MLVSNSRLQNTQLKWTRSESDYHLKIKNLTKKSLFQGLIVKEGEGLVQASLFQLVIQKIKGLFKLGPDWSNKRLIDYHIIQIIALGIENQWIKAEDETPVELLYKRIKGFIPLNPKSLENKKRNSLINELFLRAYPKKTTSSPHLPSLSASEYGTNFFLLYKEDLKPFIHHINEFQKKLFPSKIQEHPTIEYQIEFPEDNKNAIIQKHPEIFSWLKTGLDAPLVSNRMLVHVVGDEFAAAADLQGEDHISPLKFAIACLQERPEFIEEETWKNVLSLLHGSLSLDKLLFPCTTLKDLENKTKLFKQKIELKMKEKTPLLMTGGWAGVSQGHAIYYMLEPQENGLWTFKVFNRGAGAHYHAAPLEHGHSTLFPAYKPIVDIEPDQLLYEGFLQSLIELQAFSRYPLDSNELTRFNENDLYESILPLLKGNEAAPVLAFEELMSPQVSGTCAWKSLTAVFQTILGAQANKKMKYRLEMQAVWSYYEQNKNSLVKETKQRNLLDHAITSTTISLKSLYKSQSLTEEEYTRCISLLACIEKELEIANKKALIRLSNIAPHLPTKIEETAIKLSETIYICPEYLKTSMDISILPGENISLLTSVKIPLIDKIEAIKSWKPSSKTLGKDLTAWVNECREANSKEKYATTQFIFHELTRLLPVPTQSSLFWKVVMENEKPDCSEVMSHICDLFQEYYQSCSQLPNQAPNLERSYSLIKMYHLQNLLIARTPLASIGPAIEEYLDKPHQSKKLRHFYFNSEDPHISKELEEIHKDYQLMNEVQQQKTNVNILAFTSASVFGNSTTFKLSDEAIFSGKAINPEFVFIDNLLKDSDFKKKATELYQEKKDLFNDYQEIKRVRYWEIPEECKKFDKERSFHSLERGKQIAFVFMNGEKILPPLFTKLRTQIFLSQNIIKGCFEILPKKEKDESIFTFSLSSLEKRSNWFRSITVHIPSLKQLDNKKEKNPILNYKYLQRPISNPYLEEIIEKWMHTVHSHTRELWLGRPELTEDNLYDESFLSESRFMKLGMDYLSTHLNGTALTRAQTKELLNLATYKHLQIVKIITYFNKHFSLLSDSGYQTLFHALLFEKDLLLTELKVNPQLVPHLNTLLRNGYQHAFDLGDISTCVFYLNLSRRIQNYYSNVYPQKTEENHFLPFEEKMEKLFTLTGLNDEDKSLLYLENLSAFVEKTSLDEKQSRLMIKGLVHLSVNPLPNHITFPVVKAEINKAIIKHSFSIQKHLQEKGGDILNEAIKPFIKDFKNMDWKPNPFPLFMTQEGFILNVLTGEFFVENLPVSLLPIGITESYEYKMFFTKSFHAKKIALNVYEFKDDLEDTYRIFTGENKLQIQRKIDGEWYECKEKNFQLASNIPKGFYESTRLWISIKTPKKIVCFDFKKNRYVMEIESDSKENHLSIIKIFRQKDKSMSTPLKLVLDLEMGHFNFLKRFENPDFINLWSDEKGIVHLIDLDRYRLNFQLDISNPKNLRWMCKQKKGFYLSSHQFVSAMGNLKNYLVLRNEKGEKQVLVPLNEIEKTSDSAFSEEINLKQKTHKYAAFSLKEKGVTGKGQLIPKDAQASLQLAYLKLSTGRYRDARHFLQLSKMPLRGDLSKELKLLKKIVHLKVVNQDRNIEACTLRMHSAFLYFELLHRHQPGSVKSPNKIINKTDASNKLWKTLQEDCEAYVSQINRTGGMRLPLDEEKILLQQLFDFANGAVSYAFKWYMHAIGIDYKKAPFKNSQYPSLRINTIRNIIYQFIKNENNTKNLENYLWIGFSDVFHDPNPLPEDFPFSYTRPTNEELQVLLALMIKNPSEKLKKRIETCLQASKNNDIDTKRQDSSKTYILKAILEMIIKHPNKYKIAPPPNYDLYRGKYNIAMTKWLNESGISKILHDYLHENANDDKEQYSSVALPILAGDIPKEKTKSSRPPYSYTDHTSGSLKYPYQPPSFPGKFSIHPTLFVKIPQDEIKQKQKEYLAELEKASEKLQTLIKNNPGKGRCHRNELKRLKKDCKALRNQSFHELSKLEDYTLDADSLQNLKDSLELNIRYSSERLIEQEEKILKAAHPSPSKGSNTAKQKALFLRKKWENISIERLIILFARNQLDTLCQPPAILKKGDLPGFKAMIEEYLVSATRIQQEERALEKTDVCLLQRKEKNAIDNDQLQLIAKELRSERNFKIDSHPECLVLEYWANLSLRKDQLEKLDKYLKDDDIQAIHQIIMGSGKTAVLTPLISLLFADGKHLCVTMMPESLSISTSEELRVKMGSDFLQAVHPFDFTRESDYSPARLKDVKNKLLHIIENRESLTTTPKSIDCFYLKFIEIWRSLKQAKKDDREVLKKQFTLMRDILNIFRTKTKLLIDEVDSVLSCRTEVNFPIGNISTMTERDMDLLFELHECFSTEEVQKIVKCEFNKDHKFPEAPPFTQEKYHETVKPALAKTLLEILKTKSFGDSETTNRVNKFFILEKNNQELLQAYLIQDKILLEQAEDYVENIKDNDVANLLALAKEELNTLLPLCLQKNCDEGFGIDKKLFAIPFDNGKPTEGIQFSDPYETATYTIETYLYKGGIPHTLILKRIKALQLQAIDEVKQEKSKNTLSLNNTKAFQEFMKLADGNDNIHLFKISPQDLKTITANVNYNPVLKKFFFKKHILSSITFQTRKINANAQTLISLFYKVFGFSGTSTCNAQTYHDKLSVFAEPGTDAKTLLALLGKAGTGKPSLEITFDTPHAFLSQLPLKEKALALIDNGSYLRGDSPRNLSRQLLKQFLKNNSPVKGIVFYENEKKVILEAGSTEPIPLTESRMAPEERFTIYSKSFTTGADIPQNSKAMAYMTIGKNILLRDLLQSVWRMRKVDQGQKIQFIVSDEVRKVINVKLEKAIDEEITTEKIILFAIANQASQIGDENYLSFKQKMVDVIQEEVRNILLEPNADIDDLEKLYSDGMEEVFAPSTGKSPMELYGEREKKEETVKALNRDINFYIDLSMKVLNGESQKCVQKKIAAFKDKIDLLHEELISRKQTTSNMLVHVQTSIQVKEQKSVQEESKQLSEEVTTKNASNNWGFDPWPEGYKEIYFPSFYKRDHEFLRETRPYSFKDKIISSLFCSNIVTFLPRKAYGLAAFLLKKIIPEKLQSGAIVFDNILPKFPDSHMSYPLREFMRKDERLKLIAPCFSRSLKVSGNFAPISPSNRLNVLPFSREQKLIQYALVLRENETKESCVMLLGQAEAAQFRLKIRESLEKDDVESPKLSLCLYDLQLNDTIESGKINPVDFNDPEIKKALAQARLLRGEILTKEEGKIIRKWIKESKIELDVLKAAYEKVILAHHPDPQSAMRSFNRIVRMNKK